jgi:hypothetical protein
LAGSPIPSVYRTRAYRVRQRVLIALAAVALVLLGYLIGRWQNSATVVATVPVVGGGQPSPTPAEPSPTTEAPTPTVYPTLQAESATARDGVELEDTDDEGGGQNAGFIRGGDSMRFDNFDFGPVPATTVDVRIASDADDDHEGRMEIRLDRPDAAPAGTLRVTRTGGWQDWRTDQVTLIPVTGVHTVFLVFIRDDDDEFVNLNWLLFGH